MKLVALKTFQNKIEGLVRHDRPFTTTAARAKALMRNGLAAEPDEYKKYADREDERKKAAKQKIVSDRKRRAQARAKIKKRKAQAAKELKSAPGLAAKKKAAAAAARKVAADKRKTAAAKKRAAAAASAAGSDAGGSATA